jgi:hypothetical protein
MERLHSDDLVVDAVPLSEYTRQVAAAEVEREIDAAVEAAAIIKPEEPAPEEVEPLPPTDQDDIDRANGFNFSRPYDQRRRPQLISPRKTQRPPSREDYNNMSTAELMRRAGISHVDQD